MQDSFISEVESSILFKSKLYAVVVLSPIRDSGSAIIDFTHIAANPTCLLMLNKSREDLIGSKFSDILPGAYTSEIFHLYRKVFNTGKTLSHEFFYDNDGLKSWYLQEVVKHGEELVITTIDSTRSHEVSEKLVRSERLLNKAQELTKTGNYHWKIGEELFWSETLYKIHGLDESAIINFEEYLKRVHPEDVDSYRDLFTRVFQAPGHSEYSYRIVLNTGRIRKLKGQVDSYGDHNGKINEVIGFTQDVTESSEIEEDLRYEKELKDAIYQAQNDLNIGLSISFGERIIFANEGLCKIYGYSKIELKALNSFLELIPSDEIPKLQKRMKDRELSVLGNQFLETEILHKQGHRVKIAYAAKPVKVGERNLLVSVIVDVSEKERNH